MAFQFNNTRVAKLFCGFYKQGLIASLTAALFLSGPSNALELISDIAQTPLELTPTVKPNIFVLFDDSGSMDYEVMTADALSSGLFFAPNPDGSNYGSTDAALQITHRSDCELITAAFGGYAYGIKSSANEYQPDASLGSDNANCYVADQEAWRFRCSSFNTLYFDPTKTYLPWPGLRSDRTPFENAPINAAPLDPYQANSDTVNIENPDPSTGIDAFRYYNCSLDTASGNFVLDAISDENGGVNGAFVIDSNTPQEVKQNFANWFSYHRSRHLRAKALLGEFIANQNETHIGFTQLTTSLTSLEVMEMNQSFEDDGAKRDLLDALYSASPNDMTNSRFDDRYIQVARYLGCQSNNIFTGGAECPAEAAPAGTCQPNHIILASDGFQNGSNGSFFDDGFLISFGSTLDVDSSDVVISEQGASRRYAGGSFSDATSSGLFPIEPNQIRTFSDIAIQYYINDLQPSLPDDVQPTEVDINRYPFTNNNPLETEDRRRQHIKTHVVGYEVPLRTDEELLLQYPENSAEGLDPPFAWLNPLESDIGLLQNLVHAAFSGRGEYIESTDPLSGENNPADQLATLVAQGVGSTTPVAINTQGTSSDLVIYRTFFDSTSNSGDLTAQEISINLDGTLSIEGGGEPTFLWSAAQRLDVLVGENGASNVNRNIFTYSTSENDGVNFEFDELSSQQQSFLDEPRPGGSLQLGEERLDYLRGLTEREGTSFDAGQFRVRPETTSTGGGIVHLAKLGTIANAAPIFVGQPMGVGRFGGAWPNTDGETYFDFQSDPDILDREPSVLVAANDGMLHVFDADTGDERFAYVPSFVYENLSQLTDPEYRHQFFVDSTPIVEDAYIRANGTASQSWNTIAIGGLGAGGQGYYALNITKSDPLEDPADQVLWEFGPSDDADLGLSFSEPVIAMSNALDGDEQRWVAVFGNGYNNTGVDGPAVIYILFIDRGIDGSWEEAGDFVKIDLGENGIDNPNGVGAVRAIDRDGNGTIDQLYAGDLLGNLHAVDISSANFNDWNLSSNRYILFEARYSVTNERQPITTQPTVVNNDAGTSDDVIVVFATGSYFTNSDAINTDIQSIYGVVDDFSGNQVSASNLIEQSLTNTQFVDDDGNTQDVRFLSDNPITLNSQGWFIDFDAAPSTGGGIEFPGERAVRSLQLRNGILFTNTVIPQELNCGPGPGGFSLALDPQTGTAGEEVVFDINNDSVFDSGDKVNVSSELRVVAGIRFKSTPADSTFFGDYRITQLADTDIDAILTNTANTQLVGRQAWREVEF